MPSRWTFRTASAVASLVLLATACGSDGGAVETVETVDADAGGAMDATSTSADAAEPPESDASAADDTTAPTDPGVAIPEALQFTAPLVGGGEIDAASLAGTPTAFWFWAPT